MADGGLIGAPSRCRGFGGGKQSRAVLGSSGVVRQRIQDLTARDFCLYRAICLELDALAEEIQLEALPQGDFVALAAAMRDRRLLVEWLRDLQLPASSFYGHRGISEAMEEQLLHEANSEA